MSLKNYIPKDVTQQSEFLKKYPEYDGRGIKIGIIDSDIVDKSLPGMQKTTDGLPKIIECFGKYLVTIDTSTTVERNGKNYIIGLNAEKLYIPIKWKNPSDKWHLGSKSVFEIKMDRKKSGILIDDFDKTDSKRKLAAMKNKTLNCIVWFDGKKWCACIYNTSLYNFQNLEKIEVLTHFEDEQEGALNSKSKLSCKISDDGNTLQFFGLYDEHATLVSHVLAANFPDNPESNGLAPGTQIVSIQACILEAALQKCIERKIDILNFSVSFFQPMFQRYPFVQTIKKMAEEHGIIIIQAAGNYGPLYSSMDELYCNISEEIFMIGSIYTSEMKNKLYGDDRDKDMENDISVSRYSSKGPFISTGARGIDFVAPGAAITDLPKWNSKNNAICSGTSFAAPNAAGSIACLLSALKANKIEYSPAMIKMALANTAFLPKGANKLEFGNGIIQIDDAFEFIKKSMNKLPQKLIFPFSLKEPKQKGIIYVQNDKNNAKPLSKDYTFHIDSTPLNRNNTKWILKCISNENKNFVSHSKIVKTNNNSFNVKIDANELKEGSINYAEIQGFDSLNPTIGPFFHLPITVICPANPNFYTDNIATINAGPATHFFFKKLPTKFTQKCFIKITSLNDNEKIGLVLGFCEKIQNNSESKMCESSHYLEFTTKKKVKTLFFDLKENDKDFFQFCIYHYHLESFNFKLKIDFQNTVVSQ